MSDAEAGLSRQDPRATARSDRAGRSRRRRWIAVAITVVAALASALAFGWFVWLPAYRPALHPGEKYGVDVSVYQGTVDWRRVAADHIRFAYIKATEGTTLVDRQFTQNWTATVQAGIERGAYHFFSLCDSGLGQAQHFLQTVPHDPAALPAAVDLELPGNCSSRPSGAEVDTQLAAYLNAVHAGTGHPVLVYLGSSFASRYPLPVDDDNPLWIRRLLRRPSAAEWTIWQVDGHAHVSGIHGNVDLDVGRNL